MVAIEVVIRTEGVVAVGAGEEREATTIESAGEAVLVVAAEAIEEEEEGKEVTSHLMMLGRVAGSIPHRGASQITMIMSLMAMGIIPRSQHWGAGACHTASDIKNACFASK